MYFDEVKCMYCRRQNGLNEGMYQVREAFKKPYEFNRYRVIGYCCDTCEALGKPLLYDQWKDLRREVRP